MASNIVAGLMTGLLCAGLFYGMMRVGPPEARPTPKQTGWLMGGLVLAMTVGFALTLDESPRVRATSGWLGSAFSWS